MLVFNLRDLRTPQRATKVVARGPSLEVIVLMLGSRVLLLWSSLPLEEEEDDPRVGGLWRNAPR